MGVAPYKYFTYDGESSRNYDVYLTGDGVFNAPERDVEMVEIPGRNGNYALDHGKFKNISVTYKAGIVDYSESNFADKVSAVRNWLCSKVGYKRLSDDYNPNEYRMAVYKSGVNIEHEDLRTGTFEITFDCKPQRWLTSGETATAVANNGTLSNPTLFDSEPLLAVKGYGTIGFNGYEIELENATLGDITLYSGGVDKTIVLDESNLNVGDSITVNVNNHVQKILLNISSDFNQYALTSSLSCTNSDFSAEYHGVSKAGLDYTLLVWSNIQSFNIIVGTDSSVTNTVSGTISLLSAPNFTITLSYTQTFTYTASTHTLSFATSNTSISIDYQHGTVSFKGNSIRYDDIIGHSTKSMLGNPTYIDCDIGECYMINSDDEIVSLNHKIDLGSDLPKLSSGTNTFTYDNTVTELKVTPRWWKV